MSTNPIVTPILDYCLARKIERDSAATTAADMTETHQYFEIIKVGPGRMEYGVLVEPSVKEGDRVWVQKHAAEGDTPKELDDQGLALFMASRIMARTV